MVLYISSIDNTDMKGVGLIKRIISSIILSAACVISFFTGASGINVYADGVENITLLGDSITTGFGLSEGELSYGDYLGRYFNAETDNLAVNGLTTEGLLDKLDEPETISSVEEADIVCLSIGGNDLLGIFEEALIKLGDSGEGGISFGGGTFNISSEFVQNFIMEYASAFGTAAVEAGVNIEKIRDRITEINPDAELVMQTVYNPFESVDETKNSVFKPLRTFASIYMGTINTAIRETAPDTADIYLKFSEKPYLYTNIEEYDIHPNYIGHMLIAEEIIQTLGIKGDFSVFSEASYSIPYGMFSEIPEYTADEFNSFTEGELRRGTLEQSIDRTVSADAQPQETEEGTTQNESSEEEAVVETTENSGGEEKESGKVKNILSKVFLVLGFLIIFGVTLLKFIRKRKSSK